jgi:hypothetical protein
VHFTLQQRQKSEQQTAAAAAMEAWRSLLASFVLAVLAAQALVAVVESRTGPVEQASQGSTLHLLSYAVFIQTLCVATLSMH